MKTPEGTFTAIHRAWLTMLFGSFASPEPELKERLYDFSEILYRHLRFYETLCIERKEAYSYERPNFQLGARTLGSLVLECLETLEEAAALLGTSEAEKRIASDLGYLRFALQPPRRRDPDPRLRPRLALREP